LFQTFPFLLGPFSRQLAEEIDEFLLGSAKYFFLGLLGDRLELAEVEGREGVTSISIVVFLFLLFGLAPVEEVAFACRLFTIRKSAEIIVYNNY